MDIEGTWARDMESTPPELLRWNFAFWMSIRTEYVAAYHQHTGVTAEESVRLREQLVTFYAGRLDALTGKSCTFSDDELRELACDPAGARDRANAEERARFEEQLDQMVARKREVRRKRNLRPDPRSDAEIKESIRREINWSIDGEDPDPAA